MQNDISEEKIREVISKIRHSAIDCTLVELGIIKDFGIEKDRVTVTLAYPFEDIPIKEYLIMSIQVPLQKMGVKVDIRETVMNKKEAEKFLEMEARYWKGKKKNNTSNG
ncbi:MAG: metal-sulfur cluster biosynthetic enzyme [bacterium]